jgi:hypothetical protein
MCNVHAQVSVDLDSATHLKLNFNATVHDPLRHDLTSTPIFSFILAVALIALVYYHKLVRRLFLFSRFVIIVVIIIIDV